VSNGRVCVIGSFMMDLIVRAARRPQAGETVVGSSFTTFLGGKGFNQAVAAARAGARTSMIGRLGDDDYGRRFLAHLDHESIERSYVIVDTEVGTGIGLPLVEDSGENSIVIVPQANSRVSAADVRAAAAAIQSADVLLLQLELPVEAACEAARIARESATTVILNPAPAPGDAGAVDGLVGLVDVLVPNLTEASQLARRGAADPDVARTATDLRDRFGGIVTVTLGSAGVYVLDGDGAQLIPAHNVPVVDTVGAGDAYCGALGAWLAAGASLRHAVRCANAAGALAVGTPGAEPAMPTRAAILSLLDGDALRVT
jgi:ribokinase